MRVFVILVCASLSSCALVGVYGPERQQIAREKLHEMGLALSDGINNWQGQQQLERIQQNNDWNAMMLRHQLERDSMNQQLQQGVQQAQEFQQHQMDVSREGFDRLNESLMPLPGQ
jgi:hypothetical protein